MPSFLFGGRSGGDVLISGWPWSGNQAQFPQGGIQIRMGQGSGNLSGYLYVGLSGGTTVQSGGYFGSGLSGMLDGMQLGAGDSYWIPRIGTGKTSGAINVFLAGDAAVSGLARVYYEVF